jgi:hypothetical protein
MDFLKSHNEEEEPESVDAELRDTDCPSSIMPVLKQIILWCCLEVKNHHCVCPDRIMVAYAPFLQNVSNKKYCGPSIPVLFLLTHRYIFFLCLKP